MSNESESSQPENLSRAQPWSEEPKYSQETAVRQKVPGCQGVLIALTRFLGGLLWSFGICMEVSTATAVFSPAMTLGFQGLKPPGEGEVRTL